MIETSFYRKNNANYFKHLLSHIRVLLWDECDYCICIHVGVMLYMYDRTAFISTFSSLRSVDTGKVEVLFRK